MFNQSPRTRRLHNDLAALEKLRSQSSVFRFSSEGDPPQQYLISFKGKGLWRDRAKIKILETHRVEIQLGASYPRNMPEIRWITPIYHPNISEIGMVCLGGYGTHWVPSVQLDELCVMLWDMARYHNYDIRSPYNRDAALWVANQADFLFPTDGRPLRDLRAALGRISPSPNAERSSAVGKTEANGGTRLLPAHAPETDIRAQLARIGEFMEALDRRRTRTRSRTPLTRVRQFIERYRRIFRNGSAPEPGSPGPDVAAMPPRPDARIEAIDLVNSGQARTHDDRADVVRLQPVPGVLQEPEPPAPGADDIIFIE